MDTSRQWQKDESSMLRLYSDEGFSSEALSSCVQRVVEAVRQPSRFDIAEKASYRREINAALLFPGRQPLQYLRRLEWHDPGRPPRQ